MWDTASPICAGCWELLPRGMLTGRHPGASPLETELLDLQPLCPGSSGGSEPCKVPGKGDVCPRKWEGKELSCPCAHSEAEQQLPAKHHRSEAASSV